MQSILNEYEPVPVKNSRYYIPIIILFSLFSGCLILDMFIDIERLTPKEVSIDWTDIVLSVLVPGAGLAFFIAKTRIGWFISTTYFSFIAFAAIATIFSSTVSNEGGSEILTLKARHFFILITTITLSILFQTKSIRLSCHVKKLLWIAAITISLSFALLLVLIGDI